MSISRNELQINVIYNSREDYDFRSLPMASIIEIYNDEYTDILVITNHYEIVRSLTRSTVSVACSVKTGMIWLDDNKEYNYKILKFDK